MERLDLQKDHGSWSTPTIWREHRDGLDCLASTRGGSERTGPRRWRALAMLSCLQFMLVLDATVVNVALPSIKRDLVRTDPEFTAIGKAS
jgi:hypothetical protein